MICKLFLAFACIALAIESHDDVANSLVMRLQGDDTLKGTGDELKPGTQPPTVEANVVADDHVVHDVKSGDMLDGDMLVGEKLKTLINGNDSRRRGVLDFDMLKWSGGTVKYSFADNYPEEIKLKLRKAMDELELTAHPQRKCVRFQEDRNASHKIKVIHDPSEVCYSVLGEDSFTTGWIFSDGEQPMNIHSGCFSGGNGVAKHELLHALGFIHEQKRFDRDKYIDIKWENIEDGRAYQFEKMPFWTLKKIDTHEQAYDYSSLMHYSGKAFSKNGKPTIVPKDHEAKIGQREDLSESDLYELRRAYDCPVISEQNCACKKTWSVDGVGVSNYCGRPTKRFGDAHFCEREDRSCGNGTYQKCRPIDGLWKDGSICGLGTTCNWCYHKATYWYGKAFTACGPEPKWGNGTRCLLGTSCKACREKATYWYGKAFTACGPEPKWDNGTRCLLGTSCKQCKNQATYWYGKAFTACGPEPKWGDGTRCLAGTSCNACRNSYSWWWSKFGHHCGKENCWAPGTVCGRGTTCHSRCCNGRYEYRWYWFGFGKCKK